MKRGRILILAGCLLFSGAFLPPAVQAAYELKVMTPAVEAAIQSRQGRFEQLQQLKAQGAVGENNRGYVVALGGDAAAASLVNAENQDRRTIYQTIAEQNNLGDSGLAVLETVFAEVQHEKARAGDPVQLSTGEWVKK